MSNLLLGFTVMLICLALQAMLVAAAIRYYARHRPDTSETSIITSFALIGVVMVLLLFGNFLQVGVWALVFVQLGEFSSLIEAFYHSAVNFSTLGYGDVVMSEERRLLGPLEAINGVMMIGVSTATLMAAFQNILRRGLRQEV